LLRTLDTTPAPAWNNFPSLYHQLTLSRQTDFTHDKLETCTQPELSNTPILMLLKTFIFRYEQFIKQP